jgi:hypothetical protein
MIVAHEEIEREYSYRPKWMLLALGGGFFGACTALFAYLALTNERVVVIQGLLPLSPLGGKVFYWILAAIGATFVSGALCLAFVRVKSVQRIALTATGIVLPRGKWNRRDEAFVAFKDIDVVKVLEFHGNQYLYVYTSGLRYTVDKGLLAARDFGEMTWALEARVPIKRMA